VLLVSFRIIKKHQWQITYTKANMIGIVDYGCGNIASIANMIKHLGYTVEVINNISSLEKAKFIILPGVGHFAHGMKQLNLLDYKDRLVHKISNEGVPTLGICMGMQLLTLNSEEGNCDGLGIFNLKTLKFPSSGPLPHMGWSVALPNLSLLDKARFYFVHSYFVEFSEKYTTYYCEYNGVKFSAGLQRNNVMGCQFHPEKSHKFGMNYFNKMLSKNYE
jgi:glutamine amidotransferase